MVALAGLQRHCLQLIVALNLHHQVIRGTLAYRKIRRNLAVLVANAHLIVFNTVMVINVKNKTADRLTREFATLANVSMTEAVIIAMREAIERRVPVETPIQTAARIREKYNLKLSDEAKTPLPKEVFDDM